MRLRAAGCSNRTAPQIKRGGRAAVAMTQDLVAIADHLALEIEDPRAPVAPGSLRSTCPSP